MGLVLIVPAFVFLFLKFFGENHFSLPYYFPELDASGHVQTTAAGDTLFHRIVDFELIGQDSTAHSLSDFEGKVKAVSFFFSRCGTICPILNQNLARVHKNLRPNEAEHVFLSITVDPQNDTPNVLKKYAEKFGNPPNWYFLTGEKKYIYDLGIHEFKLPVSDASQYDSTIVDIDETFIHSDKVILLDAANYVRGIYSGTDVDDLEKLQLELKILLDEQEKNEGK